MKLRLECIPCYIRQTLDVVKMATDDRELHEQVLRGVLTVVYEFDTDGSGFILQVKIKKLWKNYCRQPYCRSALRNF